MMRTVKFITPRQALRAIWWNTPRYSRWRVIYSNGARAIIKRSPINHKFRVHEGGYGGTLLYYVPVKYILVELVDTRRWSRSFMSLAHQWPVLGEWNGRMPSRAMKRWREIANYMTKARVMRRLAKVHAARKPASGTRRAHKSSAR